MGGRSICGSGGSGGSGCDIFAGLKMMFWTGKIRIWEGTSKFEILGGVVVFAYF